MIERATEGGLPLIIISTSGGARMYEGMFSLMQMAKTCAALAYHAEARLPYISVLTHPTTAGVMASYASVGDLIIAEPGAMIGFAGPRVIKDTTQAELPPGFPDGGIPARPWADRCHRASRGHEAAARRISGLPVWARQSPKGVESA